MPATTNERDVQSPPIDTARMPSRAAWAAAVAGAAFVCALTLYLAFAPTFTNDFWFHLEMGEVYWTQGPWPAGDPMLHTARADAPIQHEWLFGVMLYGVQSLLGFFGIRVFHLAAVVAILALAFAVGRRSAANALGACFVTTLFAVLAWTRLYQMRPDLVTILATLLTYVLLLEHHRVATRWRVGLFALLMLVWANMHSLFALGPLLLIAALLGLGVRALAESRLLDGSRRDEALRTTRRIAAVTAAALALGLLVSLLNPRGIEQHLTFFTSSSDAAIWAVKDEWSHFDPFELHAMPGSVSVVLWLTMDGLIASFVATSFVALVAWSRRRRHLLEVFDPMSFALGAASIVAILVSVRFLWMGIFPLLFVARAISRAKLRRDSREVVSWAMALATLVVSVQFYRVGGFETTAARLPERWSEYFETPYLSRKFHVEGVQFLRDTGVEGRLFNPYGMGGFLGYWLSPAMSTYIDSRTEHYPPEVMREYSRIVEIRELGGVKTFLDILDRRGVDFFFGVGMPIGLVKRSHSSASTTRHLEGIEGWVPVSRSIHHAIYLRDLPRNDENFAKIERYYRDVGIPFDRERGFDAASAIEADPAWAVAHALMTPEQAARVADRDSPEPTLRADGLDALAWVHVLGGSYRAALAVEDELETLRPVSKAALRRQIYAAMKLEDMVRAQERAAALVRMAGQDTDSLIFQQLVTAFVQTAGLPSDPERPGPRAVALARITHRVPLLSPFEAGLLERALPGEPRVDAND